MMSGMSQPSAGGSQDTDVLERITRAGLDEFEEYGIRRANMDNIARRARVSRSTLYRNFKTKQDLLIHVVRLEGGVLLSELDQVARGKNPREAVIECFATAVRISNSTQVFYRIIEADPEFLPDSLNLLDSDTIQWVSTRVASTLRRSGSTVGDDELSGIAEVMIRILVSMIMTPSKLCEMDNEDSARHFAETYLAPLVR